MTASTTAHAQRAFGPEYGYLWWLAAFNFAERDAHALSDRPISDYIVAAVRR